MTCLKTYWSYILFVPRPVYCPVINCSLLQRGVQSSLQEGAQAGVQARAGQPEQRPARGHLRHAGAAAEEPRQRHAGHLQLPGRLRAVLHRRAHGRHHQGGAARGRVQQNERYETDISL